MDFTLKYSFAPLSKCGQDVLRAQTLVRKLLETKGNGWSTNADKEIFTKAVKPAPSESAAQAIYDAMQIRGADYLPDYPRSPMATFSVLAGEATILEITAAFASRTEGGIAVHNIICDSVGVVVSDFEITLDEISKALAKLE